jgi:hypothetical protein
MEGLERHGRPMRQSHKTTMGGREAWMAWTRLGPLGAVLLLVAGLGGHGPSAHRGGLAERMLDAVIVPAGAVRVARLPGTAFAQPSQEPACVPLADDVRYWVVSGSPSDVAAFLAAHTPRWLPNDGTGSLVTAAGAPISYTVSDAPRGSSLGSPAELNFTTAALPGGMTGIRADAEVPPADAVCSSSDGPVRS